MVLESEHQCVASETHNVGSIVFESPLLGSLRQSGGVGDEYQSAVVEFP